MIIKLNDNKRGLWQMYLLWCRNHGYVPSRYDVLKAWFDGKEPRESLR